MGRYSGRSFRLVVMCLVSIVLFVLELAVAYIGNSLSLASDAFAVLSHLVSMIIGLFGLRASSIQQHRKSTFGFLRADVVGAFGNSVFAVALMLSILIEAVKRYINPQKTEEPLLVLSAGVIGLFFNILNYVIFLDCCYCNPCGPRGDLETDKPFALFHTHRPVDCLVPGQHLQLFALDPYSSRKPYNTCLVDDKSIALFIGRTRRSMNQYQKIHVLELLPSLIRSDIGEDTSPV
ncbi:Zinc transporter 10 [Galemys pyrenaicus]|uniref:Zinc transporter 10 n=1 Tax=Galemys pyrenaicus TaxID=202257 RepID=A0A8J6DRQ7_GALPY|nr:Zinc transporter 10 [Galemys pyrenaicus]